MWENAYYIWNPATGQTTPKTPQTYSYNPATGHWDTTNWIYDATQGKYVPNTISVDQPPAGAITTGGPDSGVTSANGTTTASTQGPDSPVTSSGNTTGLFDNFYNASISNTLNQSANTGDATVSVNTTAGNATSGNASDMANVLNLLMSSATPLQNNLATFTQNVYGDVQGDILIDPSQIPKTNSVGTNTQPNNLTINTQSNGQIDNNITLGATSGNATVSQNTTAGNATTGSADAVANIMNVINSVIGAGSGFVGTVNIFGNLNGDILMPPDTLSALLASGGTPTVTTQGPNSPVNTSANNTLNANLSQSNSINNAVNLAASTGSATVTNNTSAGNATTGNANTNLTVLNLTGQQVIGKDAVLVFVNVLGKWVGMIVNAPSGATSAALGGGISTAGPNSPVNTSNTTNSNLNFNAANSINNNIKANAQSGNALVTDNTTAGNATSGNATASVNLLNISASSLNLSNWLGILFINVFGSWNGSFGIDTAAGNKPTTNTAGSQPVADAVKSVKVFSFIPSSASSKSYKLVPLASASSPASSDGTSNSNHPTVLAAIDNTPKNPVTSPTHSGNLLWTAGSLFLLAGILTTEEAIARRKEARARFRSYLHSVTVQPFKRS
jgi:hypothetical protein